MVDLADSIGQAFGLDPLDLADSITTAFGFDQASPPPRPSPEGALLLDAIDRRRTMTVGRGWEPIETIPFVGSALKAARLSTVSGAAERIANRKARDEDYGFLADYIVQQERAGNQGALETILQGTLGSLGLGAELIATGGIAGGAESLATRTLGTNLLGRVTAKGLGIAAQSAVSAAPLAEAARYSMPQVGIQQNADGELAPIIEQYGDDLPKALIKGFARHGLTVGVERVVGEALAKLPVVKQVQAGLAKAWMKVTGQGPGGLAAKLAQKTGWNGILAELGEERTEEVLAGAIGLEGDFGITGQAVSSVANAISPGDEAQQQANANSSILRNLGIELGTIALTGGVTKAVTSTPQLSDSLGRLTGAGFGKISRGEPLSRRDVQGQTSRQERADLESSIRSTMAAEADRIIKERPDAAHRLVNIAVQDRPTALASDYRSAFGEEEPHPGYAQLLLDQLRPRAEEIAAAALQKRQAEYEKEQAKPEPVAASEPQSINDLRRELTRAGIPKAKNATKEELADLHKSWTDELQQAADENEVGVDRLQHWLGVLYDREDQLTRQYDYEIGGLLSEYRKRYGLNAQAMSKTDPAGSFSGKAFSDIAAEFISETQGRFDLKDTEDVWELFKAGKLHRPTYRDLLPEAIEQAKAEADQFDPEAFGLPRVDFGVGRVEPDEPTDRSPEAIAKVYNQKTWFHGTGTADLTPERLDPFVGDTKALFGHGVYLTDDPSIAEGYAKSRSRRGRGVGTIYQAHTNVDRVLDVEQPITPDVSAAILEAFGHDYGDFLRKEIAKPGATPESVIQALRSEFSEESVQNEIPLSEYTERFQDLVLSLRRAGYDAITHTGGLRTGKPAHRVMILLDPNDAYSEVGRKGQVTSFKPLPQRKEPAELGLPAASPAGQPQRQPAPAQPMPFLADRHRQELARIITSDAPRMERFAKVRQQLDDLQAELTGDFESRLEGFDTSMLPPRFKRLWPKIAKKGSERLAKSVVGQVREKAVETLRLGKDAAESIADARETWLPEPDVGTSDVFDAFDRILPERNQDAVVAEIAKRLDIRNVTHFVNENGPEKAAFEKLMRPTSDKVGNAEGRGGGDDDGDGQPFGSPAETQAHPSVAKSASQLPWQYQGERIRKPQDSPAIIRQLVKATESLGRALPVRVGRLGRRMGRRAAGWYNPKTHVTRVKLALDTATASHEVGHAVDRLLFGPRKRWPKNAVPPAVHADLVKLGQALYPKEPHNGWESEGFAELVFLFVHDKSKLDTVPALRDWFQAEVLDANPEFAKRLEAASKMGHKWVQQGSTNRTSASMVDTGFGTGVQNLKRLYDQNRPYELLVEALAPLDELSKAAAAILGEKGKELPASKDPFKLAKRLRLTAPAITRAMIDEGMVDRTGKIVGPSLRAGVRKIRRAEYRDFAMYLWARRAIKVQASGRQAGISKKDAEQVVRDLENDRFKEAAEAIYKWTDGVLDYMASLSPDLAAGVEAIRAIDPGDYVPLQRWFEEFDETYRTSSVGNTASGNVTKRLRGSGRRVINPIESLISTTQERIEHAHQRAILESVLNTGLGVEHLGEFVEEVEPTKVPKASATLQSLLEKIRAHAGKFVDVPRGAEFKLVGKDGEEIDIEDALEEWITFWGQADNPTGPDPIFAVRKGGKVRWFYIKPRLAEALGQIQEAKSRNPVGQAIFNFIRTSNLVFKMGTTGLRAPFGVVINPIRDVQDLYQRTRSDASFARVAGNYLRAYFEELVSRVSGRAVESRESQLFRRLGLEMSQHLGRERAATRRASKGLFRTITPGKAFDYLIDLLQFSDAAARIAEIRMVAKDKGIDLDALTFDQAIDLAIAAKEATTDFSAGGRWTSFLNGLLPYFNAGVQGWAGGIRAAKRNPMRTLWRVGWKAGILASLWLQYKDDDWWKEMPSYEKWSYFHIPIKFGGRDEVLRIPVPQDTENVYTMGVLAILEAVNERDPAVALEYAQHLADTVTPTAPVILQEGAEQAANWDFFTGKPIVSEKFRDTRPSEQFNEYTSGLAKWLGENTGLSPVRIDHAIRGIGGPLTSDATRALTSDDREGEPADTPVVGTLFQRGGPLGYRPESVDQLYDRLQEANFRHTDWRNAKTPQEKAAAENEQQRQARLMLEDAAQAVTDLSRARAETKSVTDRRKITAKMAEIARDAIANYDAATPNRERFKREAKAAERARAMAGAR